MIVSSAGIVWSTTPRSITSKYSRALERKVEFPDHRYSLGKLESAIRYTNQSRSVPMVDY